MPSATPTASARAIGRTAPPDNEHRVEPTIMPIRYCLYARKSSEDDERQAMSIDSQVKEMLALAKRDGMDIAEMALCLANGTAAFLHWGFTRGTVRIFHIIGRERS